jgi:Family of unknown function (DUF6599)
VKSAAILTSLCLFCFCPQIVSADMYSLMQQDTKAQNVSALPAGKIIPPADGHLKHEGDLGVYPGDHLYEYINGGAPIYLEYGFKEVASQELILNDHTFIFDVYQMESPLAAFGIFSVRRPERAPGIGNFAFSTFTDYQGLIAYDRYLIDISAYDTSEQTADEMALLGGLASERILAPRSCASLFNGYPIDLLPVNGRHPGTEKVARGPVSLEAAMGSLATSQLNVGIRAAQLAQAKRDIQREENDEEPLTAAWWICAGYHPQTDMENRLQSQTFLALLATNSRPGGLRPVDLETSVLAAVRKSGVNDITEAGPHVFLWSQADGRTGGLLSIEAQLVFVSSSLSIDEIQNWALEL